MKKYMMVLLLAGVLSGCVEQPGENDWNDKQDTSGSFFSRLFGIDEDEGPAGAQLPINNGDSMLSVRTKLNATFIEVDVLETSVAANKVSISNNTVAINEVFDGSYTNLTDVPAQLSDLATDKLNAIDILGDSRTILSIGTDVTVIDKCYSYGTSGWVLTDGTNVYDGLLGVALGTSSADGMVVRGVISSSGLTVGDSLYLDMANDGDFTSTQTTNSGEVVRYIGTAIDTNKIYFIPSSIFIELK